MIAAREVQIAIQSALALDPGVAAIVGSRIYDGVPREGRQFPDVTFGPSDSTPDDDGNSCIVAEEQSIQIDCWVRDRGSLVGAKTLLGCMKKALHRVDLTLSGGDYIVSQVEVVAARVMLDPDGLTGHGVLTVAVWIEAV